MAYELIKVSELPELTTPSDPNVLPIQDGDYLKRISFENLKEAATGDVADDLAAEVMARESAVSGEATARGNADTAILADLAPVYSTSATYAVGDYCTKDGQLYRCTTAITTAEAWTSGHWSAVALGDDTSDLRSALNDLNSQYKEWEYNLTSATYLTEVTDIYVKIGDVIDIEVTASGNANLAVVGGSTTADVGTVGKRTFTADKEGYLRIYYKVVHCKLKHSIFRITSESGDSDYRIASQYLASKNDKAIEKYIGYKSAKLKTGHYFIGSTVGGTVTLSGATDNWVYSDTPIFVKAGTLVHCKTRASSMCCIAKTSVDSFTNPTVVVVANDNVNVKEYTHIAEADAYYWFSGRVNETEGFTDYGVSLADISQKEFTVDINGGGNYTSFTACLTALANDNSNKIIYVKEGIYDIYTELGGAAYIATISDPTQVNWRDVQPVVPPNTKIIGLGQVILSFEPPASNIGSNDMAFLFSPLNLSGSCEIENIEIHATNCRYALHQETSSLAAFDEAVHKLKNVRCKKEFGTYGTYYVCGCGIGARNRWEYESCSFEGDTSIMYSVHTNRSVASDMATVLMNNCTFVGTESTPENNDELRFVSSDSHLTTRCIAKINNCYCNGKLLLENNGGTKNKWDVTMIGCNDLTVGASGTITDNPYPVKKYNAI